MYPSTISTFTNPKPSDRLSTTPHSVIETAQNTDLTAIETFVGTLSSLQGTLIYDIRSPNSNGGGHVQTANLGGTGQTSFNKGDILTGQSSSVLAKLAVGPDNTVMTADSTQPNGVKWGGGAISATAIQNQTYTYARASVMSASVYGIVLGQAVSVLSDGMGFVVKWPTTNSTSILALTVNATGPSSVSGLLKQTDLTNIPVGYIQPSMISIVEFDSVSSVFQVATHKVSVFKSVVSTFNATSSGTLTIAHGLGQTPRYIRITANLADANSANALSVGTYDGINTNTTGGGRSGVATSTTNVVVIYYNSSGNAWLATVTMDNTNVYLAGTSSGSATGTGGLLIESFS